MPAIEKRKIKKLKKIRVLLQNRRSNTGLFRARVRSHRYIILIMCIIIVRHGLTHMVKESMYIF